MTNDTNSSMAQQSNYFDGKMSRAFHEDASNRSYGDSTNQVPKKEKDFGDALRNSIHNIQGFLGKEDKEKSGRGSSPETLRERFEETKEKPCERLTC